MTGRALVVIAFIAGCSAAPNQIGMVSSHDAVVRIYNQEVQFDMPRACDVFLERRTTDEGARTIEYDATVAGNEASIVYSIVASDPHPLQVALYDGSGMPTFSVAMADHTLEVRDATGAVVRTVDAYDAAAAAANVTGAGDITDTDGLTLLGCALAGRSTLGPIAAFLRNLASGGEVASGVGQSSENAPPVLPDWSGDVSLLGAFALASDCLGASGHGASAWQCTCWNDPVSGQVGCN